MSFSRVLFSNSTDQWTTPLETYKALDKEFCFNDDPCPLNGSGVIGELFGNDGLSREWGTSTFCNPPYSDIKSWIKKGYQESLKGKTVVFLVPARTDTKWFHEYCTKGEVRFIKGRLKFGESKNSAPFPSMIVVFKG